MARYQLTKQDLQKINQGLKDLADIMEDLERAEKAGVPNIEHIKAACSTCEERLNGFKAQYASTKK